MFSIKKNSMSLVYPFYNHHQIIQHHLETWSGFTESLRSRIEFIIVDDCSKKPLEIKEQYPIDLKVFRVLDHIYWNYGAKNLGIQKAKHEWFMLSELDHLVTEKMAKRILALRRTSDRYYMFRRKNFAREAKAQYSNSCHPATYYMSNDLYESIGGLDEDFSGEYGYDDIYFLDCLKHAGATLKTPRWITLRNYSGNHEFNDADLWYDPDVPRDLTRNAAILEEKRKTMKVSENRIRFKWKQVFPFDDEE